MNSRSEGMIEANIAYVPGWEATATRALQLGYKAVVVGATCRGDATDLQTLLPSRDVLRTALQSYLTVCVFILQPSLSLRTFGMRKRTTTTGKGNQPGTCGAVGEGDVVRREPRHAVHAADSARAVDGAGKHAQRPPRQVRDPLRPACCRAHRRQDAPLLLQHHECL